MPMGLKHCDRCGMPYFKTAEHKCDEANLHQYECRDFQKEWRSFAQGKGFYWASLERWLTTPTGMFARFYAERSSH